MSTLEETWQRVGFEVPAEVERLLVRGTLAGAVVGAGAMLCSGALRTANTAGYTLALIAGVLLAVLPKQRLRFRLGVLACSAWLPVFLPWTPSTLVYFFTVPLGLMLALEPLSFARRAAIVLGPSVGAAWCLLLERWLSARHLGHATALGWFPLLACGLFVSVGAALASLSFAADAVEPRLMIQPKVLHA